MYRELQEEVGLLPRHVDVIGSTKGWLRYRLPDRLVRRHRKPTCVGQKQIWFMLRLVAQESDVRLDLSDQPEFDHWRWVDYWYPMRAVVSFKREVYRLALEELAPLLFPGDRAKTVPPPMPPQRPRQNRARQQNGRGTR